MSFLTTVLISFLSLIIIYKIVILLLNQWKWIKFFRKLPGPNSAMKTSKDLSEEEMITGGYYKQFPRLHTLWRGPFLPFVSVHHPETMKPVLQHEGLKKSGKLSAYSRLKIIYNGLTASDLGDVPQLRKIFDKYLNSEKRTQYQCDIRDAISKAMDKIGRAMGLDQSMDVDIYPVITRLLLDIHLTSFFSYDGRKRLFDVNKYLELENNWMSLFIFRHSKWYLYSDWIYYLTPLGIIDRIFLMKARNLVKKLLKPKQQKNKLFGIKDLMDQFMYNKEDTQIDSALEILIARRGIVSGITWTIDYLAKYPNYQTKIREETKCLFDEHKHLRTNITESDFQQLTVTNMFIKEVLRIVPPVPSTERQITADVNIDGITFPAGSNFYFNIFALHHNEELWEKPAEFIPERFETIDSSKDMKFSPFLSYSRSCVAKRFSLECIAMIIGSILQRYEVIKDDNISVSKEVHLHQLPASGLNIILKKYNADVLQNQKTGSWVLG